MKKISKDIRQIVEYRDQVNSGLFQIYKVLSNKHTNHIDSIIKLRQLTITQLETLISNLLEENE